MQLHDQDVTEQVIGAAFEVYNHLGYGFLESVYKRAMKVELETRGLTAEAEAEIRVFYKGVEVGFYRADILVAGRVLVELKVAQDYCPADEPPLLNELKATGMKVGLLINFGRHKVGIKRFAF
ncbi:MAG: GxxExxY protein [Gemmataceae bacterium]|nr:GxxExxY protein [Gemmataceae bacterium]